MTEQPIEYIAKSQLKNEQMYDTISVTHKIKLYSQLVRLLTAIVYVVAELHLGRKPEKL